MDTMQPDVGNRKDKNPILETSAQLEILEVEVLPPESVRKFRKPRNLPRTEPPLFRAKSMERYCQLNEKNPELSTIVPLQSRSV
jgi:hypothetical protein